MMPRLRAPLALLGCLWVVTPVAVWGQAEEGETHDVARASALIDAGRLEEAEGLLRELLDARPENGPALLQLGRIALERGDLSLARDRLAAAATRPLPRPYLAWHLLARVELLAGRPDEAAKAWEKAGDLAAAALARRPDSVPALRVAVAAAESRGEPWAVLEAAAALLERAPSAPAALAVAAQAALDVGATDAARCLAGRGLASTSQDPALWQLLGAVEWTAGDPGSAVEALRRARELGARGVALDLALGNALVESMAVDEAMEVYHRALSEDPSAVAGIPPLALSALVESEPSDLAALLARVLAADPENPVALLGRGRAALGAGDLETARRDFEALARARPEDSQAIYRLAQLYVRLGSVEQAREVMVRFGQLKAAEDAEWERQNAAFRRRLEAQALAATDPRAALEIYAGLAADGLANTADFLGAGQALMALEDFPSAAAWFEKILESTAYHEAAMAGLAQAAERMGKVDLAARTARRLELVRAFCREAVPTGQVRP